jgi:hypothetical protein
MFEVSSDILFIVYNLYYVDQNDDLVVRAGPIHRDGGSTMHYGDSIIYKYYMHDTKI